MIALQPSRFAVSSVISSIPVSLNSLCWWCLKLIPSTELPSKLHIWELCNIKSVYFQQHYIDSIFYPSMWIFFFPLSTGVRITQSFVDARQANILFLSYITGIFMYFRYRVLLSCLGWVPTLHVIQAGLKLVILLSQHWRSQECTTKPRKSSLFHTMSSTSLDRAPEVIPASRIDLASDFLIWVYSTFNTDLEWSHISSLLLLLPKASEHHFSLGCSLPSLLCSLQVSTIPSL